MRSPSVMFVHAHPDDESLWTGGTIARSIDRGSSTSLVTCTWAAGTHRHAELLDAVGILGADEPVVLGYADGGFPESAPDAVSLCDCRFDDAVCRLVEQIRAARPDIVVTYDRYGIYGHPDHIQTHRLTVAAVDAAACAPLYPDAGPTWQVHSLYLNTIPISVMHQIRAEVNSGALAPGAAPVGTPDDEIDTTVDVSAWVDQKWSAIQAHRSEFDRSIALTLLRGLADDRRRALLGREWYLRRDLVPGGADLA